MPLPDLSGLKKSLQDILASDTAFSAAVPDARERLAEALDVITLLEWNSVVFRTSTVEMLEALEPFWGSNPKAWPKTGKERGDAEERVMRVMTMMQVIVDLTK